MRQPRDEIDVDIRNSSGPQSSNVVQYGRAFVESADSGCFLIHKRLHTKTHAVHTAAQQTLKHGGGQCAGSALDGNFRFGIHLKLAPHCTKDPLQLPGLEHCRRSSAQVNGIHRALHLPAHLRRDSWCILDIGTDAIHIAFEHHPRKNVGCKVAVAALGAAKWHRNVNTEGHADHYPTRATRKPFPSCRRLRPSILRYPVNSAARARLYCPIRVETDVSGRRSIRQSV